MARASGGHRDHTDLRHRPEGIDHPHPCRHLRNHRFCRNPDPGPAHCPCARLDALHPLHLGDPGAGIGVRLEACPRDLRSGDPHGDCNRWSCVPVAEPRNVKNEW